MCRISIVNSCDLAAPRRPELPEHKFSCPTLELAVFFILHSVAANHQLGVQFVSVQKARSRVQAESDLDIMAAKVPFSKRWIKPEIYPLFLAIGTALGICGFTMARNLTINPDVRIVKEDRGAGVLENYKEGETYKNHSLRKYLTTQEPQIMSTINNHFSGAK